MGSSLAFRALGVMLYHVLVGGLPFVSESDQNERGVENCLL